MAAPTNFSLMRLLEAWFYRRDQDIKLASGKTLDTNGGNVVVGAGLVDGVDVSGLKIDFDALDTNYTAHIADADAHHNWPLLDGDIPSTIARDSEVTSAISTHASDADAHHNWPLLDGDIPSTIARDSEVTSAISTHASSSDHDSRYFQKSEFSSDPGASSSPLETGSGGELTLEGDFIVDNSASLIFADVSTGRVGIKRGSPGAVLDVGGNMIGQNSISANDGMRVGGTGSAPQGVLLLVNHGSQSGTSGAASLYYDGSNLVLRKGTGSPITIA